MMLIGNLGKDPDMQFLEGNIAVAKFSLATIEAGKELTYRNAFAGSGVYFFVLEGKASIEGIELNKRDAAGFVETDTITVKATETSAVLAIEVPMLLSQ